MRFPPYITDKNHSYIDGSAVKEVCDCFIENGGDLHNLADLLSKHALPGAPGISWQDLESASSARFGAEFYFYLVVFTKALIGRDDFYFGEHSDALLSEHHRIHERGPVFAKSLYIDTGVGEDKGFSQLNIRVPLLYLRQRGESTEELLSWFSAYLPDIPRVDESFIDNETRYVSSEICLLFHTLVEAYCNGLESLQAAFYEYYVFGDRLFLSQTISATSRKSIEIIKEMRQRTISAFDEVIRQDGNTVYWDIYLKPNSLSGGLRAFFAGSLKIGFATNLGANMALLEQVFQAKVTMISCEMMLRFPERFGCRYQFRIRNRLMRKTAFFLFAVLCLGGIAGLYTMVTHGSESALLYGAIGCSSVLISFALSQAMDNRSMRRLLGKFASVSQYQSDVTKAATANGEKSGSLVLPSLSDGTVNLSRREREICQLLSQGYANKEIARELGLSTRTVENRLHLLYQKLGVHSRTEFMAWAARQSAAHGDARQKA